MKNRINHSSRRSGLVEDQRGAVYFEFLVVFFPLFTLFLGMMQVALIFSADIVVDYSAAVAARSASVVLPDDPAKFGDNATAKDTFDWDDRGGKIDKAIEQINKLLDQLGLPQLDTLGQAAAFGTERINRIRLAAAIPLIGIGPSPSNLITRDDTTVKGALDSGFTRAGVGLLYALAAGSVTFDQDPNKAVFTDHRPPTISAIGTPITARVTYLYHCDVPLVNLWVCGLSPTHLTASGHAGANAELQRAAFPIGRVVLALFDTPSDALFSTTGVFYPIRGEATFMYQSAHYLYRTDPGGPGESSSSEPGAGITVTE